MNHIKNTEIIIARNMNSLKWMSDQVLKSDNLFFKNVIKLTIIKVIIFVLLKNKKL